MAASKPDRPAIQSRRDDLNLAQDAVLGNLPKIDAVPKGTAESCLFHLDVCVQPSLRDFSG